MAAGAEIRHIRSDVMPGTRGTASRPPSDKRAVPVLQPWLRAQSLNITRHAAALRPFRRDEFGTGAAAPTEGHLHAVNRLIGSLRHGLSEMAGTVVKAVNATTVDSRIPRLQHVVRQKHRAHEWVQAIER